MLPAAGNGFETFTSDPLQMTDKLDLRTVLAATDWNGRQDTIGSYIHVSPTPGVTPAALISVSFNAGGAATNIAMVNKPTNATLSNLLAHSITS